MFIIQKICICCLVFFLRDAVISGESSRESYLDKIQRRYIPRLPYLMIPVIVVPIIKKKTLVGYLTIMAEIKGSGIEEYRKLQADLFLLRDEIFSDLYMAMSRLWIGPEPPTAHSLENRIQRRISAFYKKSMVQDVMLHILQLSLLPASNNLNPSL